MRYNKEYFEIQSAILLAVYESIPKDHPSFHCYTFTLEDKDKMRDPTENNVAPSTIAIRHKKDGWRAAIITSNSNEAVCYYNHYDHCICVSIADPECQKKLNDYIVDDIKAGFRTQTGDEITILTI